MYVNVYTSYYKLYMSVGLVTFSITSDEFCELSLDLRRPARNPPVLVPGMSYAADLNKKSVQQNVSRFDGVESNGKQLMVSQQNMYAFVSL
jgi:hypothetical protein